jgi:CRP-like cAMP-binding protein
VPAFVEKNRPAAPCLDTFGQKLTMQAHAATPRPARRRSAAQQVLVDYVTQIAHFSEAELDQILDLVNIRQYKKGKILIREGQQSKACYFVLKGCVRQYYLQDGLEKTTAFFTEGQPVTVTSAFDDYPSKFYLVCNEDCTVVEGRPEDEMNFLAQMPRMETVSRMGVEIELQKNQAAFADFIMSSPEERYRKLLETRPELLDRVPQYQLASYLGVTPESLSRIRKRIMKK